MKFDTSQVSFFDGEEKFKVNKPLRLIELFAGYGSQVLALKYLGIPFEHHKTSEWAIKSIQAYKDMHFPDDNTDYSEGKSIDEIEEWLDGKISSDYKNPCTKEQIHKLRKQLRHIYNNMQACHNLGSICTVHGKDLEISDTDKFCYMMFYSYPCQAISNAGLRGGMAEGSGTTSSLLWEVKRIIGELDELPQVLMMENVSQVLSDANRSEFERWKQFLESKGYKNYVNVLNATEFKIPQNRERCFMISILGNYYYEFPSVLGLDIKLKDVLDRNVPDKYYPSDKTVEMFINHTQKQQAKGNGFKFEPTAGGGTGKAITTRAGSRTDDNFLYVGYL